MLFSRYLPAFRREIRTTAPAWQAHDPHALRTAGEYQQVFEQAPTQFRPAPTLKAGAYRQLAAEGWLQQIHSLHECGCGTGDNLLAFRAAAPTLQISGSDFNPAAVAALARDPACAGMPVTVVDLEGDLRTLPSAEAYVLWGVEFALTDEALRRLARRIAGARLSVWSNHIGDVHTGLGALKDRWRPQPGRLIGWHRSVRHLAALMVPSHRLARVIPRYGGTTFTWLAFEASD